MNGTPAPLNPARQRPAYRGDCGAAAASGAVAGTVAPQPDCRAFSRVKARFFHPLVAAYEARGPNWNYALDFNLGATFTNGVAAEPTFETIVPDYRRYSALVKRHRISLDGFSLAGEFDADIDCGEQNAAGPEAHRIVLRGSAIGDAVAGAYDVTEGGTQRKGYRFLGGITQSPPPAPERSIAVLRLHAAMQGKPKGHPVLLLLALHRGAPIHGHGWCPGWNHTFQTVDASGLRLDGNRLTGAVKVRINPDCYHDHDVRWTMPFTLDVALDGYDARGTFAGSDRGVDARGPVTGTLRGKRTCNPPASMETLREFRFNMGDARGGRRAGSGTAVRAWFDGGRVVRSEAIGFADGKDILVKSSRLNAQLVLAGPGGAPSPAAGEAQGP